MKNCYTRRRSTYGICVIFIQPLLIWSACTHDVLPSHIVWSVCHVQTIASKLTCGCVSHIGEKRFFFLSTGHTHVLIGRCIVVLDGGAASTWLTPPWRSRCMQRCTRLRQIWLLRTNESMQEQKKLIEIFNHYYKAYLADQSMRREWFAVVVVVVVARLATDVRTRLDGGSRTSSSSPSPMSDQSHQSSLMPKTMLDRTKAAVSHRRSSSPLRQIDQVGSRISSL